MPGKKLLVADDSLTIQKVIRLALSNEGYEIQATSDGNDALQQLSLFRPDIVLVDISLPGRSAFDLKREVNRSEDLRNVRFVLMSSAFERIDENQAHEVIFHGRLTKPFDPANLRQVLSEVLSSQQAPPPPEERSFAPPPPAPPMMDRGFAPSPPMSPPPISLMSDPTVEMPEPSLGHIIAPMKPEEPTLSGIPPLPTDDVWSTTVEGAVPPPPSSAPSPFAFDSIAPPSGIPLPSLTPPQADIPAAGPSDDDIRKLTESTIRMSGLDDFQWGVKEPALKPFPGMSDAGATTFDLASEESFESQIKPFAPGITPPSAPPKLVVPPPGPAQHAPSNAFEMTPQLEEIVRTQVRETLEKMAQKILPEVAEKVIKQEIHRLLSEQP